MDYITISFFCIEEKKVFFVYFHNNFPYIHEYKFK